MSEVERMADQLRRAFEGDAWHGPSLGELLRDVTAAEAARRPVEGAHTIWEIVRHVMAWESIVRRRLEGEIIKGVSPEEDWPPLRDTSAAVWQETLAALRQSNQQLRETVLCLTDKRLEEIVPANNYSVYVMVQGVVQHDLYHAGQIALLKKPR